MKNPLKGLKITLNVSNDGRLTSDQELTIVQCLIMNKGDIYKTCRMLISSDKKPLDRDICSRVAVKYFENIEKSLANSINEKDLDDTLNKSLGILTKYIDEIELSQNKSDTNWLNHSTTNSLTSIVDKLTKLKLANTTAFDKTANSLSEKIVKNKALENLEKGEINDSAYSANQISVLESLTRYGNKTFPNQVSIKLTNIDTKEVKTFPSISEAAKFLDTPPDYLGKRNGKVYKGWLIER